MEDSSLTAAGSVRSWQHVCSGTHYALLTAGVEPTPRCCQPGGYSKAPPALALQPAPGNGPVALPPCGSGMHLTAKRLKHSGGERHCTHQQRIQLCRWLTRIRDSEPQVSPRLGLTDSESGWADSEPGPGRRTRGLIRDRNGIRGGPNTPIRTKGRGQGLCEQRET